MKQNGLVHFFVFIDVFQSSWISVGVMKTYPTRLQLNARPSWSVVSLQEFELARPRTPDPYDKVTLASYFMSPITAVLQSP